MTELMPLDSWSMEDTHDTFRKGTFHGVIKGVEIQKSADDLDRYEQIIGETQPDIIVETGTRAGGSAMWFAARGLEVVSIDVAPQFTRGTPDVSGVTFIRGSSINPAIVEHVTAMLQGKRVMVTLDADHHSPHVQAEMSIWGPLVTPGCYMVVEDACFDLFHRAGHDDWARIGGSRIPEVGGTLHAIETSGIADAPEWERDVAIEGMTGTSHSPVGYWRKRD
jgi:cephalosporin hydroxylase